MPTVRGQVQDGSGAGIAGATAMIQFRSSSGSAFLGSGSSSGVTRKQTDSAGQWAADLASNTASDFYRITTVAGGIVDVRDIRVPVGGGPYNVSDILI